ncbi:hypothetical protein THAOC_32871 [Thalassiosira oceanica]|uniref:Uncharacterized protein n=1 Tax=Thalassiosira oceanica TaxID=159749 RepID=K0R6A8_THAOC|nr:hypothetical protein THAOC_32871 [Thalassiosira oceanica]|eukprot:EJK48345.1 hypothetical protein THAOC_32871 [Thalassiosira oceanica]
MNEVRKRTGNDKVAGAPAAEAPKLPKLAGAAAATKIAELQAELEAMIQSHEAVVDKLNAKVDALQAENESQLREIKDLTSALQWAYANERIPRRHWLEQGHSEEYADAMGTLLNSMKQNIENLRVGGRNREIITIDFDLQGEDENWIRADHDELLMPYWKELAAALRHWSEYNAYGGFLTVKIIYIELPKVVLDILCPAFEESRIEYVFLENSHHTGDIADFAKKVLQSNHFITEVGFREFMFTLETVKAICGAIKSRNAGGQFIKSLILAECFENGIDTNTLKMILASTTTSGQETILNLSDNGMSSREAAIIARFLLVSNPRLSQLDLDDNQFGDTDAAELADALSSNTHLSHISIENNDIEENGRLAFLRAIFDVSSLSSCAASNHNCRVYGFERDISVLNRDESDYINKWSKILAMLALSSEDSFINTALLRNVPAQLIPKVLDKCIVGFLHHLHNDNHKLTDIYLELTNTTRCQKHDVWDSLEETKSLNCMYNLMKSWVVSSIFV